MKETKLSNRLGPIASRSSPVNEMFAGRSVFITGASGFIGRVLLEKLLRSYNGIKRIYILMRPKRNMQPQERLQKHILSAPIFDRIRSSKNYQELFDKIVVISGDIGQPNLGIGENEIQMMLKDESLAIVYHSAATVKFDEPLKTAIRFNLTATQSIIHLCKRLPSLICLCHVSTAYANSDINGDQVIEEKLYPMNELPEQIIKLESILDEQKLQLMKPSLIGKRPNTYTYTKSLAEHLIFREASDLPVVIVRPSIVTASWKEPMPGWVDNLNGPTGLILAVGKGLLRSMYVMKEATADIIPVDVVVNTMVVASFYTARTSNKYVQRPGKLGPIAEQPSGYDKFNNNIDETVYQERPRKPPIFHCTSGEVNPVTWGWMESGVFPIIKNYPSQQVFRYPFGTFKSNRYHDLVTRLFVHYLPALIIDLICRIVRVKLRILPIYYKLHGAIEALEAFASNNFKFSSNNTSALSSYLEDDNDRRELFIDIKSLDWRDYFKDYVLGARRYILKEKDETLEAARISFRRAYYIELGLRAMVLTLVTGCCLSIVNGMQIIA